MHEARRGMHVRHKRVQYLHEREPALITLPWVMPSIPILSPLLDPILTPLIVGRPSTTTTQSSTHTSTSTLPTQTPAPLPTSVVTAPPNPAPTPSGGDGKSSNDSGHATNPVGGASTVSVSTPSSSPTESGSSGASPSNGSPGNVPSDGSSGEASQGSKDGSDGDDLSVIINAGSHGQAFVTHTDSGDDAQETGANGSDSGDSGSNFTGRLAGTSTSEFSGSTARPQGGNPTNTPTVVDATSHKGASTGIIVAIVVIVALLLLMLLLCCIRRRAILARIRRRKQWFADGSNNEKDYSDKDGGAGTRSARSSFATTIDRGQMSVSPMPIPQFDLSVHIEQTTQVWPSDLSGSNITVPAATHSVQSVSSPTIRTSPDRTSIHYQSSGGGSRPTSQSSGHLVAVPPAAASRGVSPYGDYPSPFSVRPFSPSETFSFPKPPHDDAESRASEILGGSAKSSRHDLALYIAPSASAENENPFADFTEIFRPPSTSTDNSVPQHFAPIEAIRRPFVPSMNDEMAVQPGDEVRILKRFDDGWAVAEKIGTHMQGLIPIDCMREVEEDLPAFLAKKRISSYRARSSLVTHASVVSGVSAVGAAI